MQFPNTLQTARTEAFMVEWRQQNRTADTATYNRKFEETYERFGSDPDALEPGPADTLTQGKLDRMYMQFRDEEDGLFLIASLDATRQVKLAVLQEEMEAQRREPSGKDYVEAKEAMRIQEAGRQPKHRQQTKGAFGRKRP